VELGGQHIKAGDVVGISLLGANRDERLSPGADRFDPARPPTRHLAFGHGMHRCVGAELARMELLISLRALAERFPHVQVAASPEGLDFRKISAVYGIEALPVHLYGHALVDCGA
jgi:cytochrome P450